MTHLPPLILDLGIILITAAWVTLVCRFLKQPVVLGYLIAGFLVSSHVPFVPTITDTASVKVWAEIGVIFLMFGLGLEFSFKKLAKVGGPASISAFFEILFMLGTGYLTGQLLGWSTMDSLFLGGILSISSTTIIVRAFEELGLKKRSFTSLVFGVLIVEDLVAILLLVLLSTVALTRTVAADELVASSFKLGFFLALWFLVGIYVLPLFLQKTKRLLSDETTLIVSIGLCLLMVMAATHVGFSPALGAFVMGSILAETREGHRIERILVPVRDLFAAVFFVSVGMLIDPSVLGEHWAVILLLTFLTIVGKFLSSGIGALIAGQSLRNSVMAGMSLAQIGEFSFIIATLGLTLGVTSPFLYPIAVAVSAITTFTTPYQIKYAGAFSGWLEQRLPPTMVARLARYETAVPHSSGPRLKTLLWRGYGMKMILNSVIVGGITLVATRVVVPWAHSLGVFGRLWVEVVACLATLILSAPFLWAVVVGPPGNLAVKNPQMALRLRHLQVGVAVVRFLVGVLLMGLVVAQFAPLRTAYGIILVALAMVAVFFSRFAEPLYRAIEERFVTNLNDKEKDELAKRALPPELSPWQTSLAEYTLSPNSPLVAQTLQSSRLKERFGLTIAMIQRGRQRILTPGRDDLLLPHDRLFIVGSEDQLAQVQVLVEGGEPDGHDHHPVPATFGLESLQLSSYSPFLGKSIRECGLREAVHGLIVGLEREGRRLLSPDSSLQLQEGDLLWIVGDRAKIAELRKIPRA